MTDVWVHLAVLTAGAAPGDQAVTSLGAQGVFDQGLAAGDVDPLLSERLRWTLADGGTTRALLLADARFTLDPDAVDPWEQHRVRTLGVELHSDRWTLRIGRHPVSYGGPRLVDGVQALHRPGDGALVVGVWAGLAPDLFTTRPSLRPGGGPIVAWDRPTFQASLVGEILGVAGGIDRVGLLTQARLAPSAAGDVAVRLDTQLPGDGGPLSLADGSVSGRWRPTRTLRLDALYDAYSSLRYLQTGDLDPDLRRFEARSEALGIGPGIAADLPDPSIYQVFGLGGAWQAKAAVAPRVALTSRYRWHPREKDRYASVVPQVGVLGLAGGAVDVFADLAWTWHGATGSREDVGLNLVVSPLADGRLTFDGSARLIVDPSFDGRPGWYADLFTDLLAVDRLVVVAGASATREPTVVEDLGLGGFLWVQHRWRAPAADQVPAATTRLP